MNQMMFRSQRLTSVPFCLGVQRMFVGVLCLLTVQLSAEENASKVAPIGKLTPSLESLGKDWTHSQVTYYLDPLSDPPIYVLPDQPDPEAFKAFLERRIRSLDCEALLKVHYGKGEMAINSGGHYLMIYRWEQSERLEDEWGRILGKAPLNQGELPPFGEAICWAHHGLFQSMVFRRGDYMVRVECGRNETVFGLLDLAEAVEKLIKLTFPK